MTRRNLRIVTIPVDAAFEPYLANTVARFSYLRPDADLEVLGQCVIINVTAFDDEIASVTQDFQFCLYREKIYRETLLLRQTLIQGVMGR